MSDSNSFDYIVVGGGSAGCVMANRLSADPQIRVLLIEAGPDFEPGHEPAAITDSGVRTIFARQYYWNDLKSESRGRTVPYGQPKLMGGGSNVNGMHAQRGLARDYDEWRQYGIEGWGWDDVLPVFKKLENDLDFDGPMHGKSGPISITRVPESKWSPLSKALAADLEARGIHKFKDLNADPGDGYASVTLNNTPTARASSAASYLTSQVRARPNLTILANTKVLRITFDGRRVTGVELEDGTRRNAPNVVSCGGAIHSPALLLRSGIGPGAELSEAGVPVVADRPGVGRNFVHHPLITFTAHLKGSGRQRDKSVRPPVTMLPRFSSNVPGCPPTDMVLNLWERNPGPLEHDPLGRQMSWLMIILNKSYSQGGIYIDPKNPMGGPRIVPNLLSDSRDLDRMVKAFRMCCEMLTSGPMAPFINNAFIANMAMGIMPDKLTLKLLQDTKEAQLISTAGAFAMDFVPGMRARTMAKAGRDIRDVMTAPDDKLAEFVTQITSGSHPQGTCRLGAVSDANAVIDSRCRVIGVEGLRVVDASIYPTPMTAGPNLPTMMSAEKAAEMTLEDRRTGASTAELRTA